MISSACLEPEALPEGPNNPADVRKFLNALQTSFGCHGEESMATTPNSNLSSLLVHPYPHRPASAFLA